MVIFLWRKQRQFWPFLYLPEVDDRAAWHLEKNGKFTVKTAYRFSFSTSSSRCPFDLPVRASFWKKIWKLKLPSSAKWSMKREGGTLEDTCGPGWFKVNVDGSDYHTWFCDQTFRELCLQEELWLWLVCYHQNTQRLELVV